MEKVFLPLLFVLPRRERTKAPLGLLNQQGISKGFKASVATSLFGVAWPKIEQVCFQRMRSLVFAAAVVVVIAGVAVPWESRSPPSRTGLGRAQNFFLGYACFSGGNRHFGAQSSFFIIIIFFSSFFLSIFSFFFFLFILIWQLMRSRIKD